MTVYAPDIFYCLIHKGEMNGINFLKSLDLKENYEQILKTDKKGGKSG